MFIEKLSRLNHTKGYLCLGLDPVQELMPTHYRGIKGVETFCIEMIQASAPYICAIKANLAYFEQFGADGIFMLERIKAHIPENTLWILDAKRGDIGNTSERYAKALFNILQADAVTVNPYLGKDSVEPFLNHSEKGVFLLALTSNQGAYDFQFHGNPPLWQQVILQSKNWGHSNLGYVIGATKTEELKIARALADEKPFLIPGIGAQGGSLEHAVRDGLQGGKVAGLINVARGILYASVETDYLTAAAKAAKQWYDEIQSYLEK
ncbi:MAG: orotidine-5'-phosphate decarboxylase [bacterium]|nr:orotidine-5'-phosphate decarboxylase [bacterium]